MNAEVKQGVDFSNLALYQQALLEHHKSPVGFNAPILATHFADGSNAACGDEIHVQLHCQGDVIEQISFTGDSCAICRASASIMCQSFEGKHINHARKVSEIVTVGLSQNHSSDIAFYSQLLPIFAVKKFPVRIQCAILPWRTFELALEHPRG